VATTNPFGAGKWRLEFTRYVTGCSVVILSDNDAEGERHAQHVAGALLPVAAWVPCITGASRDACTSWLRCVTSRRAFLI
jgi:hypothetical protein